MSPRRAWILAAAVALALLAGVLGLATVLEARARARAASEAYRPLDVARVDAHQHAGPATLGPAMSLGATAGVQALVNASGGWIGDGLQSQVASAARFPGRAAVLMDLDLAGCCDADWADREVVRLVQGRAAGARGLHVSGALGETVRDRHGRRVPLDAEALEPIWDMARRLELPVVLHPDGARLDELVRLVEHHPELRFVGGGFAGRAADPAEVSRLLDRIPNLLVDTAGVLRELARHPAEAREAILAHPDRVLFGTDLKWVEWPDGRKGIRFPADAPQEPRAFYEGTFRLLETPGPVPAALGSPGSGTPLEGLALPTEALEALYHRNAERLFGLSPPEDLR